MKYKKIFRELVKGFNFFNVTFLGISFIIPYLLVLINGSETAGKYGVIKNTFNLFQSLGLLGLPSFLTVIYSKYKLNYTDNFTIFSYLACASFLLALFVEIINASMLMIFFTGMALALTSILRAKLNAICSLSFNLICNYAYFIFVGILLIFDNYISLNLIILLPSIVMLGYVLLKLKIHYKLLQSRATKNFGIRKIFRSTVSYMGKDFFGLLVVYIIIDHLTKSGGLIFAGYFTIYMASNSIINLIINITAQKRLSSLLSGDLEPSHYFYGNLFISFLVSVVYVACLITISYWDISESDKFFPKRFDFIFILGLYFFTDGIKTLLTNILYSKFRAVTVFKSELIALLTTVFAIWYYDIQSVYVAVLMMLLFNFMSLFYYFVYVLISHFYGKTKIL